MIPQEARDQVGLHVAILKIGGSNSRRWIDELAARQSADGPLRLSLTFQPAPNALFDALGRGSRIVDYSLLLGNLLFEVRDVLLDACALQGITFARKLVERIGQLILKCI